MSEDGCEEVATRTLMGWSRGALSRSRRGRFKPLEGPETSSDVVMLEPTPDPRMLPSSW